VHGFVFHIVIDISAFGAIVNRIGKLIFAGVCGGLGFRGCTRIDRLVFIDPVSRARGFFAEVSEMVGFIGCFIGKAGALVESRVWENVFNRKDRMIGI